MQAGGATEMIWHFAGYLHMADVVARSETLFDGVYYKRASEEDTTMPPEDAKRDTALEDTTSRSIPFLAADVLQTDEPGSVIPLFPVTFETIRLGDFSREAIKQIPLAQGAPNLGPVGSTSEARLINVRYSEAETEIWLEVRQANLMEDRDRVSDADVGLRDSSGTIVELQHLSGDTILSRSMEAAAEAAPHVLPFALDGAEIAPSLIGARDAAWSEGNTPVSPGAITVQSGSARFVDGVLSEAEIPEADIVAIAPWRSTEIPAPTAARITETISIKAGTDDPDEPAGVIVEAGMNTSINAARLVDAAEATGSMIVGGDHFLSKAIVQINVLTDDDHITLTKGAGPLPQLITAANEVHNVAEFVHVETTGIYRGAAATPQWKIDVVQGDFIDFRSITQTNGLDDNDITCQSVSGTFFNLQTGLNGQTNYVNVFGLNDYDVIIIAGDYHQSDWIFQYNIMIDPDYVWAASQGSFAGTTIASGANTLTNDATITTLGPNGFNEMNEAQRSLMDSLAAGDTVLVGNPEWQLTGSATGSLRVLYVNGDYYDINIITQVNVMVDIDQTVQILPSTTEQQGTVTGGNQAINFAQIVDPGTLSASQFLGGDSYEESTLIQVNIVTSDDVLVVNDPFALVPEVIAFVGNPEQCVEANESIPCCTDPAHQDHIII